MGIKPVMAPISPDKATRPPGAKHFASQKGKTSIRSLQNRQASGQAYWGSYDEERTKRERNVTLPRVAWLERP